MARLDGKVALITGGASGMGAATVRRFVAEGATVLFGDVQEALGAALAAETGAVFLTHDVTDEAAWARVMARIAKSFGRLDFTLNNAGILSFQSIEDTDLASWQRVLNVNLTGVMLGCRHSIALMKENPGGSSGSIANVSSIGGFIGLATDAAYTASKGAVRLLSKSVAVHCARAGLKIRCNSIHPGVIDTPIHAPVVTTMPDPAAFGSFMANMAPVGRMGTGDDIAGAALYLASDDSAYVTGTELLVDGGLLAGMPFF